MISRTVGADRASLKGWVAHQEYTFEWQMRVILAMLGVINSLVQGVWLFLFPK